MTRHSIQRTHCGESILAPPLAVVIAAANKTMNMSRVFATLILLVVSTSCRDSEPSPTVAQAGSSVQPESVSADSPEAGSSESQIDPKALTIGASYRVSKQTSVMPEFDPGGAKETFNAINRIVRISPGTTFRVESIRLKGASPWYEVTTQREGREVTGWISGSALEGQALEGASK